MLDNQRTNSNNHTESILCGLRYVHGSTRGEWVIGCGCGYAGKIDCFNLRTHCSGTVYTVIFLYDAAGEGEGGGAGERYCCITLSLSQDNKKPRACGVVKYYFVSNN